MRKLLTTTLLLTASLTAFAQGDKKVYKWEDADGNSHATQLAVPFRADGDHAGAQFTLAELATAARVDYDVPVNWSYYPPVHLMPVFRNLYGFEEGHLPVSEHVLQHNLNLPMHAALSDDDAEYVMDRFIEGYKRVVDGA